MSRHTPGDQFCHNDSHVNELEKKCSAIDLARAAESAAFFGDDRMLADDFDALSILTVEAEGWAL